MDGETRGCVECGSGEHAIEACPVALHRERMAEFKRAGEQRARAEGEALAPMAPLGSALAATIAAASQVWCASDDEIRAMEIRLAREERNSRLLHSGISDPGPLRDEDRKMILSDTCEPTRALQVVRGWLAKATATVNPDRNTLVLCGERGTGKTVAAAWAISQMGGRYVTLEEYLRDYSRWQRDRSREDASNRELARYDAPGLLVIDELRGDLDRWLAELERPGWHRVIDRRQSRRKYLTIGLTNATRSDYIAALTNGPLDPRTADRMKRDAYVIGVDGESMRKGSLS
jgi:hypothetical protein